MWCKSCNMETNELTCPVCGEETVEDLPVEIYWCGHCKTPIIQVANQADLGICPLCNRKTKYMSSDLRPVFPQERLLLEVLLGKKPMNIESVLYGLQIADIISMERQYLYQAKLSKMQMRTKSPKC